MEFKNISIITAIIFLTSLPLWAETGSVRLTAARSPLGLPDEGRFSPVSRDFLQPEQSQSYSTQSQTEEEPERKTFSAFFCYNAGLTTQHESISWSRLIYHEDALFALDYSAKKKNSLCAGFGYLFSDHLGIEIGIDSASLGLEVDYSALIPHPLYFNSHRASQGTAWYKGKENIGFLNMVLGFPFSRFRLDLSGGPAYFMAEVEVISSLGYTQSYPYSSVTVALISQKSRQHVFGFNAGASLTFNLFRNFGVFVMAKYYSARSDFATAEGLSLRLSLGGFKAGGGFKILI